MSKPGQNKIIAAHYFYLLRSETEDLRRLWNIVATEIKDAPEPTLASIFSTGGRRVERCIVLHCSQGGAMDFCLAMLPNLALVEVIQRSDGRQNEESWRAFMESVEELRESARREDISLFGESTLLVADEGAGEALGQAATSLLEAKLRDEMVLELPGDEFALPVAATDGRYMVSELEPSVAGGEQPRLIKIPAPETAEVEYYTLAADDPDRIVSNLFPDLDSLLKELGRSTSYFSEQKKIVISERTDIDKQIGNLLHKQTVVMEGEAPDTHELESRIASLSRMFGLLATDSLMIRQAENRLERDLSLLGIIRTKMNSRRPQAADDIGVFYSESYGVELETVRNVARDLDHSRQNAEAAIAVVRTQVDLLRAEEEAAIRQQTKGLLKQSLRLQEEGLSLQVAAGLIEFVLVFYYVLKSWEGILSQEQVEHITPLLRMIPVAGVAAGASLGTHFLARSIKNKTWRNPGLWISGLLLVLSLVIMVAMSVTLT